MFSALEQAYEAANAGRLAEALVRFELALQRVAREGTAEHAAEILRRLGNLRQQRGEWELAAELLEASRVIAERNGLDVHLAAALIGLAVVAQSRGDMLQAEWFYEQGGALAEVLGEERLATMAEQNLATLDSIRGDAAAALRRFEQALARSRRTGDLSTAAITLNNMGLAHVDLCDWHAADDCYRQAVALARELDLPATEARVVLNRAGLALKLHRWEEARECCAYACGILTRIGAVPSLAEAHKHYGVLYRETGHAALAEEHLARARGLAAQCRDRLLEGEVESEAALLYLGGERWDEARAALTRAHRILSGLDARREVRDLERRLEQLDARILPTS